MDGLRNGDPLSFRVYKVIATKSVVPTGHFFFSIKFFARAKYHRGPILQIHLVLSLYPFPVLSYTSVCRVVFSSEYVKYTIFIHKYSWFRLLPDITTMKTQHPKSCNMGIYQKSGNSKSIAYTRV